MGWLVIVVALTVTDSQVVASPPPAEVVFWQSLMQREWLEHQDLPWEPAPPIPFHVAVPKTTAPKPTIKVMGYLPYWNVGKPTLVLHFDRLHVLAYFGSSLSSDGQVGDLRHWGTDVLATLIAHAHAAGVEVVLTVTNFTPASIATFLSSPSARAAAVSNLVSVVVSGGGDGVNVDFEGIPKANKADFVSFIADLKQAFDAALGRSHVSVATPAVDWSGAYDYKALAEVSDGLFIMGYDYHWRGGPPGPVSPLAPSSTWGKYSLSWTIADYIQKGGNHNLPRFILGLPLYGYDWPTTGPDIPGTATAKAESRFYARCQREAAQYGWQWDADSSSPYYLYQDNGWHQVWCEDRRSLALKYALVADMGLGGVGFWALGYEEDFTEVWDELAAVFGPVSLSDDATAETIEDGASSVETPGEFEVAAKDVLQPLDATASEGYSGLDGSVHPGESLQVHEILDTVVSEGYSGSDGSVQFVEPVHSGETAEPIPSDLGYKEGRSASGGCSSGRQSPPCLGEASPFAPLALFFVMLIYRAMRRVGAPGN